MLNLINLKKILNFKKMLNFEKEELKKLFKEKIDIYSPSITFLTVRQKKIFEKRCLEKKIYSFYEIKVDYKHKYDLDKFPFLIYLTKEQAKENINAIKNEKKYTIKFSGLHFKKVCRETIKKNIKLNDIFMFLLKKKIPPEMHFPSEDFYKKKKKSKEVELYKPPSKKTITIGYKNEKDINDFIKKLNIKKNIGNYYPTLIYLDLKQLKKYLHHVKKNIKAIKKFGQKKVINNEKIFILSNIYSFINPDFSNSSKSFIFYLTKRQIKEINNFSNFIIFTSHQFIKTFKEVIRINSLIYYFKNLKKK